jgi:F-type H+-transporting ATPase subunit gamma
MANGARCGTVTLGFIGKRGYDFFKWHKTAGAHMHGEFGGKVVFSKARAAAEWMLEEFTSGKVDEVKVIYNEFKNAITQVVVVEDFLPLRALPADGSAEAAPIDTLVKPDAETVLGKLLERTFAIQMFRILLESQASEHGARMAAMENATRNAGEMIRKLTLMYNKQRQAAITKELLEIISGSESQKQA